MSTCIRATLLALLALCSVFGAGLASAATYTTASTPYSWIDNAKHTAITTWDATVGCPDSKGDDTLSQPIDIGFSFRFGSTAYTQLRVNSNGRVQFANTRCYFGTLSVGPPRTYPDPIPQSTLNNVIAAYVVDLDVSAGGSITYGTEGSDPSRVFVITWKNVPAWTAPGTSYTFQIQLHETGEFDFMYGTLANVTSPGGQTLGAGQVGYQLTTTDYRVVSGLPTEKSGRRYSTAGSATALRITYGSYGIYCLDHEVTISVVDSSGNPVTGFSDTISLTTTTSRGTWLVKSGHGYLTDSVADDGAASYAWHRNDSSVTFYLRYRAGASVVTANAADIDTTSIKDNGAQGSVTFTPSGFTVTSAALASPPPSSIPAFASPQTAGSTVAVHLTAYGQTPTDATCGVITTYTGAKSLRFWSAYVNPGTGTVAPTIDGTAIATVEASAAAQSVTFASGRASVSLKYKDVGRISVSMKDITTGSTLLPTGIRGSTGNVVFRPSDLVVSAVTTPAGVANPAASTATGTAFVAAGAPFRVQVQARDAEGSVTPNFGLESPAEGVRLAASSLVLPATGRNGTANDGSIGNATAFTSIASGTLTGSTFYWDEVGAIRLQASVADGDYLGTGALTGTQSGNVGRFYPSTLVLVGLASVTPACGTFSYMGQNHIRVVFQLEARNAQGTRTQNFDATLLGASGTGAPVLVAENNGDGVDLSARVGNFSASWSAGRATVDDADVVFARGVAIDGPFSLLYLGVKQQGDPDSLRISGANMNAATATSCAATGTCNALALDTLSIAYGRQVLRPGIAPETAPLDMIVGTQRWNGSAFVTSTADACTAFSTAGATLGTFTAHLAVGETSASSPASATLLSAGVSTLGNHLRLSAPGAGNDGTVKVTLAAPAWLTFDWTGTGVQANPSATATFGHFRGHDRIVYRREVR